jgi:hypothetical protein
MGITRIVIPEKLDESPQKGREGYYYILKRVELNVPPLKKYYEYKRVILIS